MKTEIQTSTISAEEQTIKSLWTALQVAEGQTEKRGLQFGQAMYEYREKYSTGGRPAKTVTGVTVSFEEVCDRLSIVRMTAYRWIARYEESIGTRLPKPDSRETTRNDVDLPSETPIDRPLESEPTPAPTSVVSPEEKDREQLCFLVKRLNSLNEALQQVVDANSKWSKYDEYAEVVSSGKKIAGLVNLL